MVFSTLEFHQQVAAYFTHFHHTLPVVDSTAFLSQYRRLMDERRISSTSETGFATVVFAVFACAARFVDDPRLISTGTEQAEGGMAAVYYERYIKVDIILLASQCD